MTLTEIKSKNSKRIEEVKQLITEAADKGFVSVTIIGEYSDGTIGIKASSTENTMNKIAALEVAKLELYKNWE